MTLCPMPHALCPMLGWAEDIMLYGSGNILEVEGNTVKFFHGLPRIYTNGLANTIHISATDFTGLVDVAVQ